MRTIALIVAGFGSLVGCQEPTATNLASRVDALEAREAASEQRLAALEARVAAAQSESSSVAAETRAKPASAETSELRYELVGGGADLQANRRFYATKERCESAKQIMIDDGIARAARLREQGMITVGEPTLSCIPT
jgi:outer membrane murein-binding lipoprotein Lpp